MEELTANPNAFIEQTIKDYINNSPKNRLEGGPIFDEPLVGFADGEDPIFHDYKEIIGDFHMTPGEAFEKQIGAGVSHVSVIAWIFPITLETRLSLRRETRVTSLRWNRTLFHFDELNKELSNHLASLLEKAGHNMVSPAYTKHFQLVELPDGPASNWSNRHICYAAGLGTFSLSDGFITPRGIAMRCGTAVCDLTLTPTPRKYTSHLANCLFYREGLCGRCIERCPAGAISEEGHDKNKCRNYSRNVQREILKQLGTEKDYVGGQHIGCGLCQTKVPCEAEIPASSKQG